MRPKSLSETKIEGLPNTIRGKLDLEEMVAQHTNKYLLINVVSRRARDLNGGARPLLRLEPPFTPLEVAIAEAKAGLLKIEERTAKTAKPAEGEGEGAAKGAEASK